MSQIYNLTAKIHKLLPQVKDKYGLEFEIEFNELYLVSLNYEGVKFFPNLKQKLFGVELPAIQHLQIRQILVNLQGVLGENPELLKINNGAFGDCRLEYSDNHYLIVDYCDDIREIGYIEYAEALDDKWLRPIKKDGKYTGQSLFDREPLFVLHELCEILENLLK